MIKACIFDLDGVIVDTAKYHYLAWKRLSNELGFDFSENDNEQLKGVSRMTSLDILLGIGGLSFSHDEKLKLAEKKNKWYVEYISKMTPDEILPGVIDFISSLRKNKIKIALASASKNAITILNQIDMTNYFDVIIDGTKVKEAKPNPEVFLKSAQELGIEPQYCIVFEDAVAGIQAAINAEMHNVGIGNADILTKADYVINNFESFDFEKLNKYFINN
ncbi:MAG: beta-phosphoglucomutase [Bacteroidetes bacterium]|nr:MAG: beta-phosphoglucomutase [Bacteroidota bacterium]